VSTSPLKKRSKRAFVWDWVPVPLGLRVEGRKRWRRMGRRWSREPLTGERFLV
jgi:hypothetical protein